MWPGSGFKYQQKLPTFVQAFDLSMNWTQRVDIAVSWLVHETKPANLVLMYFEQPDEDGHQYGPNSKPVDQQLQRINAITSYYLEQLIIHGLGDTVNSIVLSDHGMETINHKTILNLNDYLDPEAYSLCGISPGLNVQPKKGKNELPGYLLDQKY